MRGCTAVSQRGPAPLAASAPGVRPVPKLLKGTRGRMRGARAGHTQWGRVGTAAPSDPLPARRAPHSRCALQLPQQVRDPRAGGGHGCAGVSRRPRPLRRPIPAVVSSSRPLGSVRSPTMLSALRPSFSFQWLRTTFPRVKNLNCSSCGFTIHLRNCRIDNCSVGLKSLLKTLYVTRGEREKLGYSLPTDFLSNAILPSYFQN